jgi:hypothetical protein
LGSQALDRIPQAALLGLAQAALGSPFLRVPMREAGGGRDGEEHAQEGARARRTLLPEVKPGGDQAALGGGMGALVTVGGAVSKVEDELGEGEEADPGPELAGVVLDIAQHE